MGYFMEIPFVSIPPTVVKKVITGKGNAKKEVVRRILEESYNFQFKNDDESDAMALLVAYKGKQKYTIEQKEETYGIRYDI